MRYIILAIIILGVGYHTLTYGLSLWKDDKNKLGSSGAILIAILGTIGSLVFMWIRR